MKIISRKDAKSQSLKYYFTGKPCKHGHIDKRDTRSGGCYECKLAHGRNTPKTEAEKEYNRAYLKTYNNRNRKEINHRYYDNNRTKELDRSRLKRINNADYYKAKCAERRAIQKNAKPDWYEIKLVNKIYAMATKFGFEVDHIVPLQSKLVCGLHCWDNLQLLSRQENAKKLNITWPDMPGVN
jgi:hypothetical protein